MSKQELSGLIAVTQTSLDIEQAKVKAKVKEAEANLTEVKIKHDKQIEKRWMTLIKWALWPTLLIFSFLYLKGR